MERTKQGTYRPTHGWEAMRRASSLHAKVGVVWTLFFVVPLILLAAGCSSDDSGTNPTTTQLTVSLTSPGKGQTVSGTIDLVASATGAERVRFFVANQEVGSDSSDPYLVSWSSETMANGSYEVKAVAEAGSETAEDRRTILVDNAGGGVAVSVTPTSATLAPGEEQAFVATVAGTDDRRVTWSVVEGASHGNVTMSGLYTAPTTVPRGGTATVRATSVADPTKAATATVQIESTGGFDPQHALFIQEMTGAGLSTTDLSAESVESVSLAVFSASLATGGTKVVTTGTLTQTAPGSEEFTYAPQPSDRMVVTFANGTRIDLFVTAFSGYFEGTWEDFRDYHDDLAFRIVLDGGFDLTVESASGNPGEPRGSGDAPSREEARREFIVFQRSVTGSIVLEGETLQLDLTHTGSVDSQVESSFSEYNTEDRVGGTVTSPRGQINVDEEYEYTSVFGDNAVVNRRYTNRSSGTSNGVTYQWVDYFVRTETTNAVVSQTDFWIAQGSLLRNGSPIGTVRFARDVVDGLAGPSWVLDLGNGEEIPL